MPSPPSPPNDPATRRRRRPVVSLFCSLAALVPLACAPEAEKGPQIETVELGAGPTDALTPNGDPTATGAAERFAGQLPASFPSDLPVPPSSTVVEIAAGRVVFATEDPLDTARELLQRELSRTGWQRQPDSDIHLKGERRVRIRWSGSEERSRVVYRY